MIQHPPDPNFFAHYQKALADAEKNNNEPEIITAYANLGFACFQARDYETGLSHFRTAITRAEQAQNLALKVQCLGKKALAYQEINRHHDAYKTVNEILKIADEEQDDGMKCDALTSQGQILLDSGDPNLALDRLDEARKLANAQGDKRRLMNVLGVLGSHSLALTSLDQAEVYFDKAARLAAELDDQPAHIGYLGNQASVLAWQGNHRESLPAFEKVLAYVRAQGDRRAEIQALRHLSQAYAQLKDEAKVAETARLGLDICLETADPTSLVFYEILSAAASRQGDLVSAQALSQEALSVARTQKDATRELEILLSIGELHLLACAHAEALPVYEAALVLARQLNRHADEAYLTGRVGVVLAEMGRLDEAIQAHTQAIEFARFWQLPALEGEQLSMLSLAYVEKGQIAAAREQAQAAIQVFATAGLAEQTEKARQLLERIYDNP